MRWLDNITDSVDMNLSKLGDRERTGKPGVLSSVGLQRVGHDLVIEQQQILELIKRENIQGDPDPIKEYPGLLTVVCTCHQ